MKGQDGPLSATFYRRYDWHVLALATDEKGWPTWVDVRLASSFPVPAAVWRSLPAGPDQPLFRYEFDELLMFFDAIRPIGSPIGPEQVRSGVHTQRFAHAVVTWEEGRRSGDRSAVSAFSVKWNSMAK